MQTLTFILFFAWAAAMVLSIWAFEVARMFARRAAKAQTQTLPNPKKLPAVALILPIKGIEEDTLENLHALFNLKYPRLRLLFAVESQDDPVIPLINQLSFQLPVEKRAYSKIIIAGHTTSRGQKIHNQLAAVARTTSADEVLVFMDADARPHDRWLPALVSPLSDPDVGASTGYRLYLPTPAPTANLASTQVSVINAIIAALLGPAARNQAWGGSMAIKRTNFFDFGIYQAWQNALSDDYVLTSQVKHVHSKAIRFVHSCFVASNANFNWHSFFEFAPRQYKITRICSPWIWLAAVVGSSLYALAFSYPLILWIVSLLIHRPDHLLLLMLAALYITNVLRGDLLLKGSKAALADHPTATQRLDAVAFWYTWGFPLALFINLIALLKSSIGRTIQWRGISYRLDSPTHTTVLNPIAQPAPASPEPAPIPPELVAK
jgi:ceramide glucosyltransferase